MRRKTFIKHMADIRKSFEAKPFFVCWAIDDIMLSTRYYFSFTNSYLYLFKPKGRMHIESFFGSVDSPENKEKRRRSIDLFEQYILKDKIYLKFDTDLKYEYGKLLNILK